MRNHPSFWGFPTVLYAILDKLGGKYSFHRLCLKTNENLWKQYQIKMLVENSSPLARIRKAFYPIP